jgi:hypothetical protein
MPPETTTRKVPAKAFEFAADAPSLGEPKSEGAQTLIPFAMTARTGGVGMHWYWGRNVHDMGGLRLSKDRMPIDYCHDSKEVIGFADKFDAMQGALKLAGSLVSTKPDDRADEISKKGKAGVPYQASLNMSRDGLVVEEIPEGIAVVVNGETIEGPVTVFRQWSFNGVAVLPYGSDHNTSVEFAGEAGDVDVSILQFGAVQMTAPTPAPAAAAVPPTESAAGKPAETTFAAPPAKTGADFLTAFGDLGGRWFAEGKTWDESQGLFTAHLQETVKTQKDLLAAKEVELKTLKEQFAAVSGGQPVSFQAGDAPPAATSKTPEPAGLDKFAASLNFGAKSEAK